MKKINISIDVSNMKYDCSIKDNDVDTEISLNDLPKYIDEVSCAKLKLQLGHIIYLIGRESNG